MVFINLFIFRYIINLMYYLFDIVFGRMKLKIENDRLIGVYYIFVIYVYIFFIEKYIFL